MIVLDDNREFLELNPAALELLQMDARSLTGRRLDDIASGETRRHIHPMWVRFLRQGHLTGTFEVERAGIEGARLVVEFYALANFPFPGLHLGKLRAVHTVVALPVPHHGRG